MKRIKKKRKTDFRKNNIKLNYLNKNLTTSFEIISTLSLSFDSYNSNKTVDFIYSSVSFLFEKESGRRPIFIIMDIVQETE